MQRFHARRRQTDLNKAPTLRLKSFSAHRFINTGRYAVISSPTRAMAWTRRRSPVIFEPFLHHQRKKAKGMASGHRLRHCQQSNGYVFAQKRSPVWLYFPCLSPAGRMTLRRNPVPSSPHRHGSGGLRGTVLLVEDEESVRELVRVHPDLPRGITKVFF